MKKNILIVIIAITAGLAIWTIYNLLHHDSIAKEKYEVKYDSTQRELVERKKELLLKDYDSLFVVFDRETTIVYNLRGWEITLLALWITVFLPLKSSKPKFLYLSGIFIIVAFYILEVSERSTMIVLLKELRSLEKIFELKATADFNTAVLNYEFRDLRDANQSKLTASVFRAMFDPKVIWWHIVLLSIYSIAIKKLKT